MSAYFFVELLEVSDPAKLAQYRVEVGATIEQFGGRVVSKGPGFEIVEGDGWNPLTLVLIEFPDADAIRRWYHSPEYKPLLDLRLGAAKMKTAILDAV